MSEGATRRGRMPRIESISAVTVVVADMGRAGREITESRYTKAGYLQSMRALYAELGAG